MVTYLSPNLNLGITQPTEPQTLLHELQRIRQTVIYEGEKIFRQWQPMIARQTFVDSALNLAYYLALRHEDLRQLQLDLMPWGLSSLGRIEATSFTQSRCCDRYFGCCMSSRSCSFTPRPSLEAFFDGDRLLKATYRRSFWQAIKPSSSQNYGHSTNRSC